MDRGRAASSAHRGRIGLGALLAVGLVLVAVGPAAASEPSVNTNDMEDISEQAPLTARQQAAFDRRVAMADQHAKSLIAARSGRAATAAPASAYVATWERQQIYPYYCGPAAVQVVADFAWQRGAGPVKYTQKFISDSWTHTTTSGTSIVNVAAGLNGALDGSRRESFPYVPYRPTSGADWHDKLYTDVNLDMPQVANLQPWWTSSGGTSHFLHSWADHRSTGGHYVVLNGWKGEWDGAASVSTVRYDDGSEGYGGGTGTFTDPAYDVWQLIYHHNDYVIW